MKSEIQTEMFVTNMLTLLLLAIMYDTSFFKPVYLGTSLTVNLTIMLVLTTIFTSEIEELAPMSQTKMIHIWLIFNREDDTEEPPEKWKTGEQVIVDKKSLIQHFKYYRQMILTKATLVMAFKKQK